MLTKQKLFVFPTSRSIRSFVEEQKASNTLLPVILTIDEFLKKCIILKNKKYIDEEQRILFLNESIKNIDISKLGISNNFTKFLKQSDYIYRFFLELASEKVKIKDIQSLDTYDYYYEHLEILSQIHNNYLNILDKNDCVDRINYSYHYEINENFLKRFDNVEFLFEGYFTKVEFDIIDKISKYCNLEIKFYSNEYNKKSLEIFKDKFESEIEVGYEYKINLSKKKIISKENLVKNTNNVNIKAFNSRINQIAYIKTAIVNSVNSGINPSNIALVLPDESFATSISLFDNERYFNYAMGKSILWHDLYLVSQAISNYINEDEIKNEKNLEFIKLSRKVIDENIKKNWNNSCTEELFTYVCEFIKGHEKDEELLEKFDEVVYRLKNLFFSSSQSILLKDIFKILLQKIAKITLDDVNSGKITVMGLLETRASSFDTIIICDFNESFIPKQSVKDKFLSTRIKQKTNLPTSFDREMLQKYYYKRLIESSKNVFISYVNSDSNQISRFANELFPKNIEYHLCDNSYRHILYNNHQINHFDENIIDNIDLTKFIWSATSLKTYLQCKRKFYLQYILKIKDHDISLKPKAFELGDIIHRVLEKYYTINSDSKELSYEKIEELFTEFKSSNPFLILDLEIWKRKLYDFYIYDTQRLKDRSIIGLEKNFEIDFDGIKLKGIIDRIDKYGDIYEVIDYKTSNNLKVDTIKNYEKTSDFQLEFYYLAMSEIYKTDKVNTYYYNLSNIKLIDEVALDKKLELLVEKFDEIKEVSKKEISFKKCEEKNVCQFCPYVVVCNRE